MDTHNNNNNINVITSKRSRSSGKKDIPSNNKKPRSRGVVMKDVRLCSDLSINHFAGFCKDAYEYFRTLYSGKDVTPDQLAALRMKVSMILWRLDNDYNDKKYKERIIEGVMPQSALMSPMANSETSNEFNDF